MGNDKVNISVGGGGGSFLCAIIILLIFHTSCVNPETTTGMLHDVCVNGMGFWDWVGTICFGPIYLVLLLIYSTGIKIW